MGFLMGAYGKLMAGKLVREIQFQMTSVQSRLRRVTREVGLKEKMFAAQERNMKMQMQNQMMEGMFGSVMGRVNAGDQAMAPYAQMLYASIYGGTAAMNGFNLQNIGDISNPAAQTYSNIQQAWQMQYTKANTMWQNMFEMQKEAELQALKDLEDDLQVEKDNLESRLKIAQGEYEAYKEEEKQGAQNLKPDYTGQG